MYKRTKEALISNPPPLTTCMFKAQYGKAEYSELAFAITTRINSAGSYGIVEIIKDEGMSEIKYVGQISSSQNSRVIDPNGISYAMTNGEKDGTPKIIEPISCAMRGRNPENPSERGRSNGKYKQRIEMGSNISNTITSVQKDALVAEPQPACIQIGNIYPDSENMENRSGGRVYSSEGCSPTLLSRDYKTPKLVAEPQVLTPKRTEFGKQVRKKYESGEVKMSRHNMTELEPRNDGISNTITSVQKDNYLRIPQATEQGYVEVPEGSIFDGSYPNSKTRRGRLQDGGKTSPTLMASGESPCYYEGVKESSYRIRKLTERECFRLMGVSETDIDKIQASGVSRSQQYKMAGNSIVVDVLEHIFRKLFVETGQESQQLSLF